MDTVNLWAMGGIGLTAGLLGSMLGLGGGFLIVPLLSLALRLPIHIAIGSSLVAIVASSTAATGVYIKARLTNIKLAMLLETAATTGAIVGAFAAALLSSSVLSIIFSVVLVYIAISMLSRRHLAEEITLPRESQLELANNTATPRNHLAASYYDSNVNQIVVYNITHVPQGLGVSLFAGVLSSLLGIGSGIIKVPLMSLIMGVPMKAAIATSNFMIGITAAVGAFVYYFHGYVYPAVVAPLVIGVLSGATLGAMLAQRTKGAILRRIFAVFLLILAILMLLRAANIGLPS